MTEKQEARFEQIAQDTIVRAEREQCSEEDFAEGLRSIAIEIKERYAMACDEYGIEPEPI